MPQQVQQTFVKPHHKIHNGHQIPNAAIVHVNGEGKEFYISGTSIFTSTIKMIETGEFIEISNGSLKTYIDSMWSSIKDKIQGFKEEPPEIQKTEVKKSDQVQLEIF